MGKAGVDGGQSGHGTHHRGHHGHLGEEFHVELCPAVAIRQVRATDVLEALDAAAGGVEQTHIGQLPLASALGRGELVAEAATAPPRPATHREVAARQHHLAPAQARRPFDGPPRNEGRERVALIGAAARERVELAEAASIHQPINALPHRELAPAVLTLDALGTAHLRPQLPPQVDLRHLRPPARRTVPFRHADPSESEGGHGTRFAVRAGNDPSTTSNGLREVVVAELVEVPEPHVEVGAAKAVRLRPPPRKSDFLQAVVAMDYRTALVSVPRCGHRPHPSHRRAPSAQPTSSPATAKRRLC